MGQLIEVDVSRFPLVVTTVRGFHVDDVREMQRVFEALLARQRPFVTITDSTIQQVLPSGEIRREIARWNREHEEAIRRYNVAGVAILESALTRAALRAIHWLAPHPTPYAYVGTMEEALAFTFAALRRAGVEPPDASGLRSARFEGSSPP